MKNIKIALIILGAMICLYACKDAATEPQTAEPAEATKASTTASSAKVEPPQNELGVWHYTCALGCPGGAGSAVQCSNCKNLLSHNQAYHGTSSPTQSSSPMLAPGASATAEPSQNAAGVWHYTCSNGCSGGSGSASKCLTCGETLAHNSAYH